MIRRALVLRAKYRVQEEKERIPLIIVGVHPFNRVGLYPMEETVMIIGLSILSGGFSVCVQEIPQEEQQSAQWFQAMKYETYLASNKEKADAVESLATTFSKPHSIVYGTLSHSHLLLILRAMSSGAKWPTKENSKDAGLEKLQDHEGRWSLPAFVAKDQTCITWCRMSFAWEHCLGRY